MTVIHGIRIAAAAALAVVVSSAASGGCADSGACAARADHALLQARSQLHNPSRRAVNDYSHLQKLMRDCAEFGVCDEPPPLTAERWSLLQERQKMRQAKSTLLQEKQNEPEKQLGQEVQNLERTVVEVEQKLATTEQEVTKLEAEKQAPKDSTKVAFDCGSSGTTAMIVSPSDKCQKQLQRHWSKPHVMISHKDTCATDNEESCGAKGATIEKCNVAAAFSTGKLSKECSLKWAIMEEWASQLDACFTSTTECWGAATAGNRLVSQEADREGWAGFQTWAANPSGQGFLCGKFLKGQFTSNSRTETIPGTMEAAMEVETLIAKEPGNVKGTVTGGKPLLAFGSAGGSSAQFGIRLSSARNPALALDEWGKLVEKWRSGFKKANYPSKVDVLEGDYLNTYTATDGSVWGVGSFLGNDKCDTPAGGTTTPMGGIAAMKCGMMGKTGWAEAEKVAQANAELKGPWDALTEEQMEATMKGSDQGKFAAAVNAFIHKPELWGETLRDSANAFRCVAKIHLMMQKGINKADEYETTSLVKATAWSHGTKMAYAYMSVLGFIPEQEFLSEMDQGGNDFAWLDTAATLGIEGRYGKFADQVEQKLFA